jgi:hypothetical protein
MIARYLNGHKVYLLNFPSEDLPEGSSSAVLKHIENINLRCAEIARRVLDVAEGAELELQSDEFVCLVKGPESLLEPLLAEGVLDETGSEDQTPEELLVEDLFHVLSQGPLKLEGILLALEELTGWRGINPEWVLESLQEAVHKGGILCVDDEYVVPSDDDETSPPRSPRHEVLHTMAQDLGEPACTIIRELIDEIYGEEPLEN